MRISTVRDRSLALTSALFFVASLAISLFPVQATALSGSDFNAGNIIDNAVFYNPNTMSVSQIQAFLNKEVATCDSNGTQSYSGSTTRASYSASRGYPAPFTCLKDYYQNPTTGADNYGNNANIPAGAISSAQIIYNAAQTYGVSPQVILVTLQKESSIVTDDWPWTSQYRTAMGYGCPDSGPNNSANCSAEYYGFANQVTNAAKQFRRYATSPNQFNFAPGYTSNIQYNPSTGCGSRAVYIQNQATASLYNYTPYQPNDAALNNLYGTGDGCSAYGNRNFWRIFNEWFGNTFASAGAQEEGDSQTRVMPISFNGKVYVFYYDAFNRALRAAIQTGSSWSYSVLDGDSSSAVSGLDASVGGDVTATVYNGTLQVFYYDKSRGNLRHGWLDTAWHFENLDGDPGAIGHLDGDIGINPSVTTYNNAVQLLYYDKTRNNMRHAWLDGTGWHFENLDGDVGSVAHRDGDVGVYSTITGWNGMLEAFYYDQVQLKLRHAWLDTNGWHFENIDGDRGSIAGWSADVGIHPFVTTYGSTLQLFYYDRSNTNLRHGWFDNTGWHFENLDGDAGAVGRMPTKTGLATSAVEFNGSLQVYYYDVGNGNLRHAWLDGSGWHFENLDGDMGSVAGFNSDDGINPGTTTFNGTTLELFYYDRTRGTFRHGWSDAQGWHFEEIGPNVIY